MKGIRTFLPGIKTVSPASNPEAARFFKAFKADLAGGPDYSEARFVAIDIETGGMPSVPAAKFGVDPGREALSAYTGEILLFASMGIDARYHCLVEEGGDGSIVEQAIGLLETARLALADGDAVYALVRVRLLSGRPVMVERAVYPDKIGRAHV